jgi:hypothetical protein
MTPQQKTVVVFLIAQPVRPEAQILIGLVDEHEGGVKSPLNTMAFRPFQMFQMMAMMTIELSLVGRSLASCSMVQRSWQSAR